MVGGIGRWTVVTAYGTAIGTAIGTVRRAVVIATPRVADPGADGSRGGAPTAGEIGMGLVAGTRRAWTAW